MPAGHQNSLETADEDAESADDSPPAKPMEQNPRLVRPMAVVSNFNGTRHAPQPTVISGPMVYHDREPWLNWMNSGTIEESDELFEIAGFWLAFDNYYPSSDHILQPSLAIIDDAEIPDYGNVTMILFRKDLQNARQYLERGRHFRAEIEYCMVIQNYINRAPIQSYKQRAAVLDELVENLRSCTESQGRTTVLGSLDLLQSSTNTFLKNSLTQSIALPALEKVLHASQHGVYDRFNAQPLVKTLDDSISISLQMGLHSYLERALPTLLQGSWQEPGKNSTERCRLGLFALACDLEEYLDRKEPLIGKKIRFVDLCQNISRLWWVRNSFQSELFVDGEPVTDLYVSVLTYRSDIPELDDRNRYSTIQPLVTELASATSIMGWSYEAESLFTILRSTQSLEIIMKYRKLEISVEYCVHLERQKRYAELLSVLHVAYVDLKEYQVKNFREYDRLRVAICRLRDILKKVPSSLGKLISSDEVNEIRRVDALLRVRYPLSTSGGK